MNKQNGIACGKRQDAIFRKGEVVDTVSEEDLLEALITEIEKV